QSAFDISFLVHFFSRLENRLDRFRATARASSMDSVASAAVMGAEFASGRIQNRVGFSTADGLLQKLHRRGNGQRCILSFKGINDRFAFRRNFLAQMEKGIFAIKPYRILVGPRNPAPNVSLRVPEHE